MTLELRNVVKRVGAQTHIHETSVALAEEGFNVLLGTTLAGKTTLMQLMAGLERPTSGEIWFNGKNVTGVPVQKRNVSMVYQQFINYPNFTVFENIASPLRVARMKRSDIQNRVHRMAEVLRLTPMLQRYPARIVGRATAANGAGARACQGLRPRAARRTFRQPRLQAQGRASRRASKAVCRVGVAPSSSPPPTRWKRCLSADTPPRCMKAASRSSAARPSSTGGRRPAHGTGLFKPSHQYRPRRQRGRHHCPGQ